MDWVLNKWYKKAIYLLGYLWIIMFLWGFIEGLIKGGSI